MLFVSHTGIAADDARDAYLLPSSLDIPASMSRLPNIKISILRSVDHVDIAAAYPCRIESTSPAKILADGSPVAASLVRAVHNGIQVGSVSYSAQSIKFSVERGYSIRVNKRDYRGAIFIIRESSGKLHIINEVHIEDYLKGVLPAEVNHTWPMEALKAQAVVARTYALFKWIEKKDNLYQLEANVLSQVYKGKSAEKMSTNEAVDVTVGEVLLANGRMFPAFFHSACGGQTAHAEDVWKIAPNSALSGVACSFCNTSKFYTWNAEINLKDVESKLKTRGYTMSPVSDVAFQNYDASGRARLAIITHQKGRLEIPASDFRLFVGPELIRSTKSSAQVKNGTVHFQGLGWGHGVGFCQWGAKKQADLGKSYDQILSFYYQSAEVKTLGQSKVMSIAHRVFDWVGL